MTYHPLHSPPPAFCVVHLLQLVSQSTILPRGIAVSHGDILRPHASHRLELSRGDVLRPLVDQRLESPGDILRSLPPGLELCHLGTHLGSPGRGHGRAPLTPPLPHPGPAVPLLGLLLYLEQHLLAAPGDHAGSRPLLELGSRGWSLGQALRSGRLYFHPEHQQGQLLLRAALDFSPLLAAREFREGGGREITDQ